MASPGDVIITMLRGDATLVGLVDDRIYEDMAPDKAQLPHVVFQNISGVEGYLLNGSVSSLDQRWQFNSNGTTKAQAKAVRDRVCAVMKTAYLEVDVAGAIEKVLGSVSQSVLDPRVDRATRDWYAINDFLITFGRAA